MAWSYSTKEDSTYNHLYGDPTKNSKSMRHYKQYLLDSAVERKAHWSGGFFDPTNGGRGEVNNSRIEQHVKGKYYKVSTQHSHELGRTNYYVGEKKIDYISRRVKELSKSMGGGKGRSGKGGG